MAARTAFRNWLRSRAVECNVPGQPPDDVIATQCKLGNADLAEWLVQNGWARAKDGTPMADGMKKAEEAKLGIFGNPPAALPALRQICQYRRSVMRRRFPPETLTGSAAIGCT